MKANPSSLIIHLIFFIVHVGIHECSVNNNDCGGNSLCLVANGTTGVCSCPTLSVLTHELQDGKTIQSCIGLLWMLNIIINP